MDQSIKAMNIESDKTPDKQVSVPAVPDKKQDSKDKTTPAVKKKPTSSNSCLYS
jgi:hypothetical protein